MSENKKIHHGVAEHGDRLVFLHSGDEKVIKEWCENNKEVYPVYHIVLAESFEDACDIISKKPKQAPPKSTASKAPVRKQVENIPMNSPDDRYDY